MPKIMGNFKLLLSMIVTWFLWFQNIIIIFYFSLLYLLYLFNYLYYLLYFFLLSILLVDLLVFCYEIPLSLVLPKLLFSYYHLLTTCLYENWSELKLVVNFKPLNLKLFFSHVCLTNFAWKNFKSQLAMWVSFNWCN